MSEDQPTIEQTKAFATGLYQGAQLVADYMKSCATMIDGVRPKPKTGYRDSCVKGLWMRAYAWMNTVSRLNDPLDFQALSVANRALLEITVDLVLLHADKTNASGWKMHWYGESQKMKGAEQIIDYYRDNSLPLPDQYEAQLCFVRDSKFSVDHLRKALWPNKKDPERPTHPRRWTGSGNLFDDIVEADEFSGSLIKSELGVTLTEYYRTEYPKMNWRIHSGVAAFWNQPPEAYHLITAFAFKWCSDLAMLCTKIVLIDFGFDIAIEGLRGQWDEIKHQRDVVCFEQITKSNNDSELSASV